MKFIHVTHVIYSDACIDKSERMRGKVEKKSSKAEGMKKSHTRSYKVRKNSEFFGNPINENGVEI